MACMLLMRGQHVVDPVLTLIQLIVNRQHGAARKAEDRTYFLLDQTLDQDGCSIEFHPLVTPLRF